MFRFTCRIFLPQVIAFSLAAQTQGDLRSQSRGVDFQSAPYTKPLKTSATLPATCAAGKLLLWTSAPPGANIYSCLTAGVWTPQAGSSSQLLAIQNGGVPVGSRG